MARVVDKAEYNEIEEMLGKLERLKVKHKHDFYAAKNIKLAQRCLLNVVYGT